MHLFYSMMSVLVVSAAASIPCHAANSAGGSSRSVPNCSPAPCVLQPNQATQGPNGNVNAPIVADPSNSEHLLLGSYDSNCPPDIALGFHLSFDAGSDWNDQCMVPVGDKGTVYYPLGSMPILGYDLNGVAYIGGAYVDDSGFGFEGFEESTNGLNWTAPAPAVIRRDYFPNYCWMAVDTSPASPRVNSLYISCVMDGPLDKNDKTSQTVVSHSNDGGATWHQVDVAPAQASADVDLNTAMTIGKDGTAYLTWMYCNSGPNICDNDKAYMVFSKSSDGGNSWTSPESTSTVMLNHMGIPNTEVGVTNTPAIGVDNSNGRYAGNLYVVMYNWTGTFMQVQVVRSTDGGNTWSTPVPVAPGITHDQFFPWISVSPNGLVGVSWLDRRNDPNNIDYQAYAAISADGGLTFQPNVQLTTAFSDPGVGGERSMGEYTGNTWDGPNFFIAAWMDSSNGVNMQDVVGGIRLK